MPTNVSNKSIKISSKMYSLAKWTAEAEHRSIAGQIEFWAKIGKTAMDNPDLPVDFILDTLISKAQNKALAEPFQPE